MKKTFISILIIALMVSLNLQLQAQDKDDENTDTNITYNSLFAQLSGGFQQFYGDIHNDLYFPGSSKEGSISWYGNAKVGYHFNNYWGLRAHVSYGKLFSEYKDKSSYFDATTIDYNLEFIFNLTTLVAPKKYNKKFYGYFAVGAGLLSYNSINMDQNGNVLGFVGYDANGNKTSMELARSFTFSSGLSYRLSDHFDIGFEVAMLKPGIDDLDTRVRVLSELDRYSHIGVNLTYTFGNKDDAWKWNPYEPQLKSLMDDVEDNTERLDSLEEEVAELQDCMCEPKDAPDDDEDGVPNHKDLEPNTPKDVLVNYQGKTIPVGDTTKQDGVMGSIADGPMHFNSIYFALDKSYISQESYKEITKVAMFMQKHKKVNVIISGNTDIRATDKYNDALSGRRTKSAYDVLVNDFDIDPNRLSRENLGESETISKKHFINRRVDFFLAK